MNPFESYTQDAEQDEQGDGDLPTYDDLAAQSSPNSRFGRWRGWIEKRAAERYADITPAELARRRARGWGGNNEQDIQVVDPPDTSTPTHQNHVPPVPLRIRTEHDLPPIPSSSSHPARENTPPESVSSTSYSDPPAQSQNDLQGTASETIQPTHLQLHQFGSRFLPHATWPIRCILPINRDRLLLIGTDNGLSVLDMYPMEWASDGNVGIVQKGPGEAQARVIWTGEAVYQMSILEHEDIGEGTPQGVILALVGPDPEAPSASSGYQEPLRNLRMYNLASLTSLAKWTVAQRGTNPVDLRRASDWNIQQTPVKKHRSASSITRGLKYFIESPIRAQQTATSYESYLAVPNAKRHAAAAPVDASWDVVDDLPLRWATDFVPLASSSSRLANASVISYALWHDGGHGPGGGRHGRRALLAVATKSTIFLYETPKGERAFHFVKEFYTPTHPRQLMFAHQMVDIARASAENPLSRHASAHARCSSSDSYSSSQASCASSISNLKYSAQMAVFVVFEKRAWLIRIADAAVTEVEMYDTGYHTSVLSGALNVSGSISSRRSRTSVDLMALRESKGNWILPSLVDLPAAQLPGGDISSPKSIYVLTRGRHTHIIPAPLPAVIQHVPPIHTLAWSSAPSSVSVRACIPASSRKKSPPEAPPFLQLIAFSEEGIEVEEIPLTLIVGPTKGKGKERSKDGDKDVGIAVAVPAEPRRGQLFIGETCFLTQGGHWHRLPSEITAPVLERTNSASSTRSFESVHTDEVVARLKAEAGAYGWLRKSSEDWRVFWVGGDTRGVGGFRYDEDEDGILL